MGQLEDANQILDKSTFADEQGISPEDDEAKEIENGEFCKPGARNVLRPKTVQKVAAVKRVDNASQEDSGPKKKKAKKA